MTGLNSSQVNEMLPVANQLIFSSNDFGLKASDPRQLLNLCQSLCDLDGFELQRKVNNYIQRVTGAKTAFIINLTSRCHEAVVQVVGEQILDQEYRFSLPGSILNEAVLKNHPIVTEIFDLDKDLLKILYLENGHTFLNIPIESIQNEIVLLCCIIDYKTENESQCVDFVQECFRYCVGTLVNTIAYEEHKRLHLSCHSLLTGARNLISHLGDVTDLLREIMTEARKLTKAERCSLFLLDEEGNLVSKVFDGVRSSEKLKEVKIKAGQGIAGYVARTGSLLNINDAYAHPLFYKEVDIDTGFRTRNILCFPIVDKAQIIGVAQLCNKMEGGSFNMFDEEVATAFSVYCGISIMHSLVYKKIQDAQARSKLSNELMMYYMKVEENEVDRVIEHQAEIDYNMNDFMFSPRNIPLDDTLSLSLKMFEEMGFIQHFKIPIRTLVRFIMYAKKGYRNIPYHNWSHAFGVQHFIFFMLKNGKMIERGHLSQLEGLALLVSAMCHDIDHRGTTNQFQLLQDNNSLAKVYSSEGSFLSLILGLLLLV
uniref:Phosphodiesterase n=1 Tax=Clastoptera arizonana TaxID=38151 RepID=A0A1B6DJA3_9HEMI